jgi:hypothetical protein
MKKECGVGGFYDVMNAVSFVVGRDIGPSFDMLEV